MNGRVFNVKKTISEQLLKLKGKKKPMKNTDVENLNLHSSNTTRILLLLGILLTGLWITFGAAL
jgi:hypothetical protein